MSTQTYSRRPTRAVFVGDIGIGGHFPIRIQSMATSDTKDTVSVVREIEALTQAGCEIVRLTVPTKADCQNLIHIRRELSQKRIKVPLVADIHFTPSIAMDVVEFVEKVRINPGNFIDKKLFKSNEYSDEQYNLELARIEERFSPLVEKCKQFGVAMRIGTNHGSLSDRIMNRYGDTPEGMVESALEFLRVAAKLNYHDIVLSMKASNTQVMIAAYRLLSIRLAQEGMNHPFHLGVTEAGDGEDGRIKSAVGIGTLLQQGLGDTVRVSLTEDSIHEIPVAGMIVSPFNQKFYTQLFNSASIEKSSNNDTSSCFDINNIIYKQQYDRRKTQLCKIGTHEVGAGKVPQIWLKASSKVQLAEIEDIKKTTGEFEGIECPSELYSKELVQQLKTRNLALSIRSDSTTLPNCQLADKWVFEISSTTSTHDIEAIIKSKPAHIHLEFCIDRRAVSELQQNTLLDAIRTAAFAHDLTQMSFSLLSDAPEQMYRVLVKYLDDKQLSQPLTLRYTQSELPVQTDASMKLGSLLIDGLGDSIVIETTTSIADNLSYTQSLLQACRVRTSKTEFIACPSCGRTLFNLQDVTAKIKSRTSHLKGLKIAIMGCIVNGPGEMADADFGYVGTGTGKISLYVGKNCVTRNIPEENALDSLIGLIKDNGRWMEPESE